MVSFDSWYFILNALLLFVFTIVGRAVTSKHSYWKYAALCIVAFTLISGLRYARGNDYIHYTEIFKGLDDRADAAFLWLNDCLAFCGFNEYSCYLFYAFVFVTCGLYFLRDFISCAKWTFPLFIIGYLSFDEFQIRQAFSYSFLFVFMHYLFLLPNTFKKLLNWRRYGAVLIKMTIWGALCISMHSANIVILTLLVIGYLFSNYVIPYYVAIPCYLMCEFVVPRVFDYSLLKVLLMPFSELQTTSAYVERADYFFTAEGSDDIYLRNPIVRLYEIAGVSALLYLTCQKRPKLNEYFHRVSSVFYNLFFVGVSVLSAFRGLELLHRIGHDLSLCWVFLLAIVVSSSSAICRRAVTSVRRRRAKVRVRPSGLKRTLSLNAMIQTVCYWALTWFLYDYLKYILMPGKMTLYIWDAPIGVRLF